MKSDTSPRHQPELKPFQIQRLQAQEKEKHAMERHIPTTQLTRAMENPITLANQKQTTALSSQQRILKKFM